METKTMHADSIQASNKMLILFDQIGISKDHAGNKFN